MPAPIDVCCCFSCRMHSKQYAHQLTQKTMAFYWDAALALRPPTSMGALEPNASAVGPNLSCVVLGSCKWARGRHLSQQQQFRIGTHSNSQPGTISSIAKHAIPSKFAWPPIALVLLHRGRGRLSSAGNARLRTREFTLEQ